MCQELTPLAVSSDWRCIHRCEHGTIHLTWDVVNVYLDLETLAQVIEATRQGQTLQAPGKVKCGPCQLFYTRKGYFQLWVGSIGFVLSRVNFEIFVDLVQVAFKEITQPATQTELTQNTKEYQRTVKATARQTFSKN